MLEFLTLPFMQRALVAGFILAILLSALGIFVLLRKLAFFGDGIAHSSLAGIALGLLVGFAPLPVAIGWAVLMAIAIYYFEKRTKLPSDALIGIMFTASMALGVVLLSVIPGYQPELISFLFGSILAITVTDIFVIGALAVVIVSWLILRSKHLVFSSIDPDGASVHGVRTELMDILLMIALAVSIVLGVKILGIILVSALLILPPSIGRLVTKSFKSFVTLTIILSEIIVIGGLVVSYYLDTPSGATIILLGSVLFLLVAGLKPLITKS